MSEGDNYAYELRYPESMGGDAFYAGEGRGDRIDEHEKEARRGALSRKHDIIRDIWAHGEEVVKVKVAEDIPDIEAKRIEADLIAKHGFDNLSNLTNQGRSRQIQCMITQEVKDWLESQRERGESVSKVAYRILEERMKAEAVNDPH